MSNIGHCHAQSQGHESREEPGRGHGLAQCVSCSWSGHVCPCVDQPMTSHMCGVWTIPWACVLILRAWTIPFCLHMVHTTSSQHHVLGRHHSLGQPCPCHTWCNNGAGARRKFAVVVMLTTTTFLIFVVTYLHFGFYNCVQTQTNILIGKYKITQN